MLYFIELRYGAHSRNFLKNGTIWHYLDDISTNILRKYCMLNLKTFKDHSFMQNHTFKFKDII